jgi:hypothetical protein
LETDGSRSGRGVPMIPGARRTPPNPRLEAGSERADDGLVEFRAPWYVRLVGWILAVFGVVNVTALVWVLPALFAVGADVLIAIVVLGVVPLVGGIGTIASRRWGWVVSLVAVTLGILFGIASWAFQGVVSTTAEGVEWTWLTFLVLPALAMLGAFLAPATLRWLRASVAV